MPDVVTTVLDAAALLALAAGLSLLVAAGVYGLVAGEQQAGWYAVGAGLTGGGLVLGAGSWWATRRGGQGPGR